MLRSLQGILIAASLLSTLAAQEAAGDRSSPRILESIEVTDGLHTTVFNRVAPPVLKPWAPPVKGPVSKVVEGEADEEPFEEPMPAVNLWGHASVDADGRSEVWLWTHRGEVLVRSSADFRLLADWLGFESGGVWIQAWFTVEPAGAAVAAPAAKFGQVPAFDVVQGPVTKEVLSALEALHACYAKNLVQLKQQHAQRERLAAEAAREAARPPRPTTTVVNFFPIRQ